MDKGRMFLHRDELAENNFMNGYLRSLVRANEWIIPIMKIFGIPITLTNVIEYSTTDDIHKAIVTNLTCRAIAGNANDLSMAINAHGIQETEYKERIQTLIRNLAQIKIKEKKKALHLTIYEEEIQRSIYERDLREKFESATVSAEENIRLYISQCKLAGAKNYLILDGDVLKFDEAKIQEKFNVYAEGNAEIRLLEKLQQLANLMNEIYGENYHYHSRCFNIFFECTKEGIKINHNIEKKEIEIYSKNIQN